MLTMTVLLLLTASDDESDDAYTSKINITSPVIIVRFLLNFYLFQATRVAWKGCTSSCVTVLSGIRQRAVLSPRCIVFTSMN